MASTSCSLNTGTSNEPPEIADDVFLTLIARRSQPLLCLANFLQHRALDSAILTRPLLGELLSQAAQVEELLDAYGARCNKRWHPFRHLIATAKGFANAGYKLLHIQHSFHSYRLLPVEGDFQGDLNKAIVFCGNVLMHLSDTVAALAEDLNIAVPSQLPNDNQFAEHLPPGRLAHDRTSRKVDSAEETVAHLATAFLNLAAASDLLHTPSRVHPDEFSSCIPDPVNEEEIRQLQERFHNLQSMYDTFVLDTDTESLDQGLPVLRGHVSVIFHLLEVATIFTHHYERHIMSAAATKETANLNRPIVNPSELLHLLMGFPLAYSSRHLIAARDLCQRMLKRYARTSQIEVPIPKYRGFHVRPSTLISRIAHHYGSDVQMRLSGEIYDASAPLDLFRANEAINARKRRAIAELISSMPADAPVGKVEEGMIAAVRNIVTGLAAQGRIVIYERPLPLEDLRPSEGETLAQFAVDEITRLLAMGKIDIESSIHVTFIGDERVLADIRLLAENGYGEDAFGNNIPLPDKLEYLRR